RRAAESKPADGVGRQRLALVRQSFEFTTANVRALRMAGLDAGAGWRLEAYWDAEPNRAELTARLGVAAAAFDISALEFNADFSIEMMPAIDWVKRVQENSPPVSAGRFYIYGSHVTTPVPEGQIGIRIDAGAAFGTGTHETTQGCLMAFDRISRQSEIGSALDLGCGSGILAIGMAKLWRIPILAADNDPMAVEVTIENSEFNGVADRIQAILSEGCHDAAIGDQGPFELIAANILAEPLIAMAPEIRRHMAPDGQVVLSGLLDSQSDNVVAAYQRAGLNLADIIALGEWHTLIMQRQ
ncbi:MAG: 50S ribosomal protein L11 methyltransferase, partial [Rhodospirillales bacterium]|nr:50S ribosomal protein L11 methyltransferase [Rhodospirillales bacterium]